MIQHLYPGRAYKRLLYFVLIWTCVCFVAFRVTFSGNSGDPSSSSSHQQGSLINWDDYFSSFHNNVPGTNNNRGLLQQLNPPDYSSNPSPEAISILKHLETSVAVDTSAPLSEQDLLVSLSNASSSDNNYNNLPLLYWSRIWRNKSKTGKASCRPEFPSLFELDYNNIYWQRLQTLNATFYLYAAYYDDRWRGGPLPMVRVLTMVDKISPPLVMCLLWFQEFSTPIMTPATYVYGWYPKWGNYADGHLQPFIITCKIPRIKGLPRSSVPSSVSIVQNKCDKVSNNLRVNNHRPAVKQRFAVCVKGLDFLYEDMSVRLVEWLELLRILGASKVFLYDLEVHPNISKVINYYSDQGLVEVTKISLPGNQPNLPGFRHLYLKKKLTDKRQNELIPYNDCLYRNLYSYEYLALLDIDEIIMPLRHDNWSDMMNEVLKVSSAEKNFTRASYNFRNVYFLDDLASGSEDSSMSSSFTSDQQSHLNTGHEPGIPSFLHMLQHVYRSRNYTKPGQYVKCFHNTERVVSISFFFLSSYYFSSFISFFKKNVSRHGVLSLSLLKRLLFSLTSGVLHHEMSLLICILIIILCHSSFFDSYPSYVSLFTLKLVSVIITCIFSGFTP